MRLVPAGEFILGSSVREIAAAQQMDAKGASFVLRNEMPQCTVQVPAFYIGVFAVTNSQFAKFLTEVCPTPQQLELWLPTPENILPPPTPGDPFYVKRGFELHPAIHVSWFGADAYCHWVGARLPAEVEWEKAARGTDGRIFPWGNEWRDNALQWRGIRHIDAVATAPVDAFPDGRSPFGIFQMAGNVDEWCADAYEPYAYRQFVGGRFVIPRAGNQRVLRGGSCQYSHPLEFRCAMRRGNEPAIVNIYYTGLRYVCDAERVLM